MVGVLVFALIAVACRATDDGLPLPVSNKPFPSDLDDLSILLSRSLHLSSPFLIWYPLEQLQVHCFASSSNSGDTSFAFRLSSGGSSQLRRNSSFDIYWNRSG